MTPSLAIPTDNIYKFQCLAGLALVIVGAIAFVSLYSASLDRKVQYSQAIMALELKTSRMPLEDANLRFNKHLVDITASNENYGNLAGGGLIGLGLVVGLSGYVSWLKKTQLRDDRLVKLQMVKLRAEIRKMKAETEALLVRSDNQPELPFDAGG